MTLRIATWNLWWRFENWQQRQPAILEALRSVDADLIALNETWPDQTDELAAALGMHSTWAGREADDDRHPMGNAILSRWPIARRDDRFLEDLEGRRYRTVVYADIDSPHGRLPFFCTHLEYRFDRSATRIAQLQSVSEFVAELTEPAEGFPPILCGDLNAVPDSDEIRRLTGRSEPYVLGRVWSDAWELVGEGPGLTWSLDNEYLEHTAWPNRRIDYVMIGWPRPDKPIGNPTSARLIGIDTPTGVMPSDHFGLQVEITV